MDILTTFINEVYRPTESFRLEVYKIIGGKNALTKYSDEEILKKLRNLKCDEKLSERDMTQWALDHIS
jgi:hypothetical protein